MTAGVDHALTDLRNLADAKARLSGDTIINVSLGEGAAAAGSELDSLAGHLKELSAEGADVHIALPGAEEVQGQLDHVTAAMVAYHDATDAQFQAMARLSEIEGASGKDTAEYAAQLNEVSAATLRALDAQIALGDADIATSGKADVAKDATVELGDANVVAGVKAKKSAEESGFLAKAWDATKIALLGVGAAIGYGVYKAAGFNQAMEHIHTQAGVAQSELGTLGSGVLKLAGQVGQNPDSLAEALYHVSSNMASVGGTAPQMLDAVKIAAEGASVGGANLVDVTNALGAAIASGIPGVSNYQSAMGALNATVGAGDMTMEDLASAMGTGFLSNVKIYGSTLNDVGAILATFGDNNIRGAKAGTQLRMSVQSIAVTAATAGPYLKQLGLATGELGKYQAIHGTVATIDLLAQKMKEAGITSKDEGNVITELFGKKAGAGIAVLVDQVDRLNSKSKVLETGAKGFGAAWAAQGQTTSQQFANLKNGLDALVISLGVKLLPTALTVVRGLSDFVALLQRNAVVAGVLGGILGTVLAGIALKKLEEGVSGAVDGFESMWKAGTKVVAFMGQMIGKAVLQTAATEGQAAATEGATGAQEGLNVAMELNPIGLIIIGITLLVVAFVVLWVKVKAFRDFWFDAWHDIQAIAVDVWHWLENNWKTIVEGLLIVVTGVFGLIAVEIYRHFSQIVAFAKAAFSDLKDAFQPFIDAYEWVIGTFDKIKNYFTTSFDSWWAGQGAQVKEIWHAAWSVITDITKVAWTVITTISRVGWAAITGIARVYWGIITDLARVGWGIIRNVFDIGFGFVKAVWAVGWDVLHTTAKIAWAIISAALKAGWIVVETIFDIGWSVVTSAWRIAWQVITAIGKTAWDFVAAALKIGWDIIIGIFNVAIDLLTGHWSAAWNSVRTTLTQVWNAIKTFLGQALNNMTTAISNGLAIVVGFFRGLASRIVSALSALGSDLRNLAQAALNDLLSGAKSAAAPVINFFKGLASGISGIFKSVMGIASPSSVFHSFGVFIMKGLANGLNTGIGGVGKAMGNVQSIILAVLKATGKPLSWLNPLEILVSKESGGNQNAINPISVLGEHAEGMWQMLPSTFNAYKVGGSLWNGIAEGIAAVRYISAIYGSPMNIPGLLSGSYVGYDQGGILTPGFHMVANLSGRNEQVIPAGGSGSGVTVNVYCHPSNNPDETAKAVWQQLRVLRTHLGGQPLGLD